MADCRKCKHNYKPSTCEPKCNRMCDGESDFEPITKYDQIHAMSIEELAEFLPVVFDCMCNPTEECMKNTFVRGECTKTTKCALRWLQSEAE